MFVKSREVFLVSNDHFLADNGLNYKIPLDLNHTAGPPCDGVTMRGIAGELTLITQTHPLSLM